MHVDIETEHHANRLREESETHEADREMGVVRKHKDKLFNSHYTGYRDYKQGEVSCFFRVHLEVPEGTEEQTDTYEGRACVHRFFI